ncbi:hypothetical protein [Psychromonas hadalis]|uniref:hypothetical protein n=1 Tax=Psychromonas hadalis TaxID=211669 RepID=UPI0003B7801E|nr:hypothetical protein [Psychromonas hadalis]
MKLANILQNKPNQHDTLSIIEAIESDFSETDKVLIKADWVMQDTVAKLQAKKLSEEDRHILISQLNAAITSVQIQLYNGNKSAQNDDKIVA